MIGAWGEGEAEAGAEGTVHLPLYSLAQTTPIAAGGDR